MSKYTLSRIPKHVEHIFQIYVNTAKLSVPHMDLAVRSFLDKSSAHYETFNQSKLRLRNDLTSINYNPRDFPPILDEAVATIFDKPVLLEGEPPISQEVPITSVLEPNSEIPLLSQKNKRTRNFTDFQARILTILASHYTPCDHVPKPSQLSFAWYRRLLQNTPIIFFLRQKHLLMDQENLQESNFPLENLHTEVNKLRCDIYTTHPDRDKVTRNYYLTELDTPDIFSLAVRSEGVSNILEEQLSSRSFWRRFEPYDDKLLELVKSSQQPAIFSKKKSQDSLKDLPRNYPLKKITAKIEELESISDIASVFPFDLSYTGLHMLTIEASVAQDNHKRLLDVLEGNQEFEVYAVRMAKSAIPKEDYQISSSSSATYDQLLEQAKKSTDHVSVLQRIAEWGLTSVEENQPGSAFYLYNKISSPEKSPSPKKSSSPENSSSPGEYTLPKKFSGTSPTLL